MAQASQTAWTQCVSDVILSQVNVLLNSSQLFYRDKTKDFDGEILWTHGELYEMCKEDDSNVTMIRCQAKIIDPVTKKHTHDFIISIPLVFALTDDFQLIINELNMQSSSISDDGFSEIKGVTLH